MYFSFDKTALAVLVWVFPAGFFFFFCMVSTKDKSGTNLLLRGCS
jgi:hypothetical protein